MLANSTETPRDWLGLGILGFGIGIAIQFIPFYHGLSVLGINRLEFLPLLICLLLGTGLIIVAIFGAALDQWPTSSRPQLLDFLEIASVVFIIFVATYLITVSVFPIFQFLPDFREFPNPMVFIVGQGGALVLISLAFFVIHSLFE